MIRPASILILLLLAGAAQARWLEMNFAGTTNEGGMLEEVLSRSMKPDYYRQKYAADVITMSHECTHDVNSRITNDFGGIGWYGFYVGGGKIAVFREPKIRISDIAQRVTTRYRNFHYYFNVVGPQQDHFPFWILDEWVAAINGAITGHELNAGDTGDRYMAAEFSHYANAVLQAIKEVDPSYPELADLEEFVAHEKERTKQIHAMPPQKPRPGMGGQESFVRTSNPQQCQSCIGGTCSTGYSEGGWEPVTTRPTTQPTASQPPGTQIITNTELLGKWETYIQNTVNTTVENKLEGTACQCKDGEYATSQELEALTGQVAALAESTAQLSTRVETVATAGVTINQTIERINERIAATDEAVKTLDHDTPIRVYLPDGTLAGESKTNIFKGESIDLTFNPRALLDEANRRK